MVAVEREATEQRPVLTVDEVAAYLRISRGLCYEAVRQGWIPSIRIGRRLLVPRVVLERLLDDERPAAPASAKTA